MDQKKAVSNNYMALTMIKYQLFITILLASNVIAQNCSLSKPFFGYEPPGDSAVVFAPNIISSEDQEHSFISITQDLNEIWWSKWPLPFDIVNKPQVIMTATYEDGKWNKPKVAPFSGKYREGGPILSYDNTKLFFYSRRPVLGSAKDKGYDIWYVNRLTDGWSVPTNLGDSVNTVSNEGALSISKNNNLYFMSDRNKSNQINNNWDIFVSIFVDGEYLKAKSISQIINTSEAREAYPFISPDESFILFNRDNRQFNSDGSIASGTDILMIAFKNEYGDWNHPISLDTIFTNSRFASLSPYGDYLFFTRYDDNSDEDFYWVNASFVDKY